MRHHLIVVSILGLLLISPVLARLSDADQQVNAGAAPASPAPSPDARANVDSLIGWPSGPRVVQERAWEDRFMTMPSSAGAAAIEAKLSSVPHRAGTPADYATALFVRDRLIADGFDAKLVPYEVFFTSPTTESLELTAPQTIPFDLLEGDPAHHTDAERSAGPPFMEFSGDGDVAGPLFYINHGNPEDWKALADLGVNVPPGAIVVERLGAFSRDPRASQRKWDELKSHHVAGVIVYYDPFDDGVYAGDVWPAGNFKNNTMAERIGGFRPGIAALQPPGDQTLPGQAPVPGKPHLAYAETPHADIPELMVTQSVARTLMRNLNGTVIPREWHDGFEMVEHAGGNARVHLVVKMERKVVRIWNVIGRLRGATKPDEIVTIGSHRDAMVFGAIDPGSGTTVMLQDADGFKQLLEAGWKPDRTIEIASWDGHELGLYGSISRAYAEGPELRKHVVQYINTDQLTTGPPFVEAMSPELWAFGRELAAYVKGLDGKPLLAGNTPKSPLMRTPGGGSDHATYIYWLGIPSSSTGYYGHFGAHHSAEDNIAGLQTYDPGLKQAVITAQFTGVQAMRAAGAERMPLRLSDVPAALLVDLDAAVRMPQFADVDFGPLRKDLLAYRSAAAAFDAKLQAAERAGDTATLDALESKAMLARDAFWMSDGLSYNRYWHTIDRYISAFPEVNYAAFETQDRAAKVTAALDRLRAAIARAIAAISS
jgi:N-acetylated-alpha-linked acidic dipeptidase